MELPKAIKIEDVQGGKQVVLVCPEDSLIFKKGDEIFRYETVFVSLNGKDYPALDAFIQNGILNGFTLSEEPPARKEITFTEVKVEKQQ